jgi:hypothetical protein
MVTAAWIMRLLADYQRLALVYRPAVTSSLGIALLALVLAALQPPPLAFSLVLFAAMSVQWAYSAHRWLETPDGIAETARSEIESK